MENLLAQKQLEGTVAKDFAKISLYLNGSKLANFSLKFEFFQLVKGLLHEIFGNFMKQAL